MKRDLISSSSPSEKPTQSERGNGSIGGSSSAGGCRTAGTGGGSACAGGKDSSIAGHDADTGTNGFGGGDRKNADSEKSVSSHMLPPHPFFHLAMVAPDLFDVLLKLDFANLSLLLFKLFSDLRLLA